MLTKRIIPCLDIKDGRTVKGTNFVELRDAGDPVELAMRYCEEGADELVFLDITASKEGRTVSVDLVKDIGDEAFMPFGVGGGINDINQIELVLKAGAEKVVINTNAVLKSGLIEEAAKIFGSQSIVVSIDAKKSLFSKYGCWIKDGSENAKIDPIELAKKAEGLGAGELIINSIELSANYLFCCFYFHFPH